MDITKNSSIELKGIAVLLLLFHHFFYNIDINIIKKLINYSKLTVGIFIFLSGYGLCASYSNFKESYIKFFIKNLKKLYKTFIFIFIFSVLIGSITNLRTLATVYNNDLKDIALDLFGLLYLFKGKSFNITWWYMSLIIILYLFFGVIHMILKKNFTLKERLIIFFFLALVLKLLLRFTGNTNYIIINKILFNISRVTYAFDYLLTFILGIITYFNKDEIKKIIESNINKIIIIFAILSFLRMNITETKIDCILSFLFCGIYSYNQSKFKIKNIYFLKILGIYSYEIFLTHTFLYYYYFPIYMKISNSKIINFIWFFGLSLLLAVLLNKLINYIYSLKICTKKRKME